MTWQGVDREPEGSFGRDRAHAASGEQLPQDFTAHWHFGAALEASPTGMLLTDARGIIVLVNRQVEVMFGFERSELIGQPIARLVPGRFGQNHPQHVAGYLRDSRTRAMGAGRDLYGLHKQGREVPVEIGLNPMHAPEGTFVLCSIVDISERKAIEHELRLHRERLEDLVRARTLELELATATAQNADRAKSEFLTNMSHELRTPMHAILAYARLCSDALPASEVSDYLTHIADSGNRLLLLINSLLDRAKLEAAKMIPVLARHDVEAVALDAIRDLQPLIKAKRLIVRTQRSQACHSCQAEVDRGLMLKVFANVLANAIQLSSEGQHIDLHFDSVQLELPLMLQPVPALQLEISDEALGIPAAETELIFEKFVQGSATRNSGGGTGLGLAICKQIVELHRGTIHARTNDRGGATFTVTLPLTAPST